MNKKFNFTILRKLIIAFGLLTLIVAVSNILIINRFSQNSKANERIYGTFVPSVQYLNDFIFMVAESDDMLKSAVFIEKNELSLSRQKLEVLHDSTFNDLMHGIIWHVRSWQKEEQNMYYDITSSIDSLFLKQSLILDKLESFDDYQNAELFFEVTEEVSENGDIEKHTQRIFNNLYALLEIQENNMRYYNADMEKSFKNFETFIIFIAVILAVSMILIGIMISRTLIGPINKINKVIKLMGKGLQPKVSIGQRSDEIGEMADSLKHLISGLKETSKFALKIGESNFDSNYSPLSEDDVLGNSLILMRENLIKANREAELRRKENYQRNWSSQGLAEFNDLIREASKDNDLERLSQEVVFKLVRYLDASLGGLFIVNDDDKNDIHLSLSAFYAYDRQKFIQKRIEVGENLVGQCYLEKQKIYVNDVPENYTKITSGLGADKPKSVLIVPLKINEIIYGIVELASFNHLEEYQIEFVEKIGEVIATAISSVKINIRTNALLSESNEKSKRLEKQETIARQSISEIEASLALAKAELEDEQKKTVLLENEKNTIESEYEKAKLKHKEQIENEQKKLSNILHIVNQAYPYYELSLNDEYSYVNDKYLNLINFNRKELLGKKHNGLVSRDFINSGNYKKIWDQLKQGITVSLSVQYLIDGKSRIFTEKYVPILSESGQIIKVGVFCGN